MLRLYSMKGCPLCDRAKEVFEKTSTPYESIMDRDVLMQKGITHVPVLELDDGNLISGKPLAQYLQQLENKKEKSA